MGFAESKYNCYLNYINPPVLCNLRHRTFLSIPDNKSKIVNLLLTNPNKPDITPEESEIKVYLKKGGFLIKDFMNEIDLLKMKFNIERASTKTLSISISPTLNCNFRCVYCFERHKKENMNESVRDSLIKFIERESTTICYLGVNWFGGEPLLKYKFINGLSRNFIEICENKNIRYEASMSTNGYLLSKERYERLVEDCLIGHFQITIDGDRETHDKRRPLCTGEGTFEKILENLKDIASSKVKAKITIRINVDKDNGDSCVRVLNVLDKKGLKDLVDFYFYPVNTLGNVNPCIAAKCFTGREYLKKFLPHFRNFVYSGFKTTEYYMLRKGFCETISPWSWSFAPDGRIYKCTNDLGNKDESIGYLDQSGKIKWNYNLVKWLTFNPFEDEGCIRCKYLPICMGGCPYRRFRLSNNFSCEKECPEFEESIAKLYSLYSFQLSRNKIMKIPED